MDNKKLIEALRNEFAPRIREMCADGKFDCNELCAGNILTAQCIVLQAADRIEALTAQLTASERQRAAAVEFIRHIDSEYGRYITDAGFERWRGSQEAGEALSERGVDNA